MRCELLLHTRPRCGEATRALWVAQAKEIKVRGAIAGVPGQSGRRPQIKTN